MKSFACGDVVAGCNAKFVCSTDDEILAAVAQHAQQVHGLTEISAQLAEQVRSKIAVVV